MDDHFLYLTTTGRTSGEPRSIEIWFVEHEGRYYLVSEHREASHWVKNLQRDPAVTLTVGTRLDRTAARPPTRATARVVRDADEPELARVVRALMDAKYRWSDGLIVELAPEPTERTPSG